MSLRADFSYACDRCGADIGNAGYMEAVAICGMDPNNEQAAWRIHLCVPTCRDAVLDQTALANYYQNRTPPP